jgi:hypothetical protein
MHGVHEPPENVFVGEQGVTDGFMALLARALAAARLSYRFRPFTSFMITGSPNNKVLITWSSTCQGTEGTKRRG